MLTFFIICQNLKAVVVRIMDNNCPIAVLLVTLSSRFV
jgi:hypothetical protein